MKVTTPRLVWIKRRARRLQNYYRIDRRLAIYDAWIDWIAFSGERHDITPHL